MKQLNNQEVKQSLLNILLDFQKACNDKQLLFYLMGGSLLGAIRHHGFIPWDDDIDVCMARPDYDRLLYLVQTRQFKLPTYLEVTSYELGNSKYPFIKVIDHRTKIIQKYNNDDENSCLWIDVFPIDGLSNNQIIIKETFDKIAKLRAILMLNFATLGKGTTLFKRIAKVFAIPCAKLIGTQRIDVAMDKLSRKYDYHNSVCVGNIMWGLHGATECMPQKAYAHSVNVEFEHHQFKAMSCWNEYLTNVYGDYMQIPKDVDRDSHNFTAYLM